MSDNWRPKERDNSTRYRAGAAPTLRRRRPTPTPAPGSKPWGVDITGNSHARAYYEACRKALGLTSLEPMTDSQRLAFETAYTSRYVDFGGFLAGLLEGRSLPDAIANGMRIEKEREQLAQRRDA